MGIVDLIKDITAIAKTYNNKELINEIAELQNGLLALQGELYSLREENDMLKKKINIRENAVYRSPFYYIEGQETPYCPNCYDTKGILVHLVGPSERISGFTYICSNCGTNYIHRNPDEWDVYLPTNRKGAK